MAMEHGDFIIYALLDPRDRQVRYVGMTKNPKERLSRHVREARRKGGTKRLSWVRSLVAAGCTPEMVELERTGDWHEAEQFWIAYLRSVGADLVNGNEGGQCAVTETASKPWAAGVRGVRCPTATFLKAAADAGVPESFRDGMRADLAAMGEKQRCEAELRFAEIMEPKARKQINRWLASAGDRTLAVACGHV